MKKEDLYLEIITPVKTLYQGDIISIDLPGTNGRFTILRNHGAIISILTSGKIQVVGKDGVERFYTCNKGSIECKNNRITVLIDKGEQIKQ